MTKQELRAALKERRAAIPAEQRREMDARIVANFAALEVFLQASALLVYAPLEGEINLLPLVRIARERGIPVAFPRCDVETNTMQFYELLPSARLTEGAYRIPEPPADAPLCTPDARALCILPALSLDPTGARIGYGKGYYDRYLATFPGIRAGAIYSTMILKRVPTEPHDLPVSLLVTERGVRRCAPTPIEPTSGAGDTGACATDPIEGGDPTAEAVTGTSTAKAEKADKTAAAPSGGRAGEGMRRFGALCSSLVRRAWTGIRHLGSSGEGSVKPLHAPPILVLATFLLLLLSRPLDTLLATRSNEYAVAVLLQVMIFLIPAVLYGVLRGDGLRSRMRLRLPRFSHLWFCLWLLIVMISGGMLFEILTGGVASLEGNFTLYETFVARTGGGWVDTLILLLTYALLPAIGEETVYRAILCTEYEKYGAWVSILSSGFFFALLHFSFALFPAYLLLGVLLAVSMYVTRSLLTPLLLHLGYNVFCLFGQPYLSAFYNHAGSDEIFTFCIVVIFLLFSAFAVGEARKIYHRYAKQNLDSSYAAPLAPRHLPRTLLCALLSPVTLACVLIFLIMAIV